MQPHEKSSLKGSDLLWSQHTIYHVIPYVVSIIAAGIKLAYCGNQHPAACLKLPLCPIYSPEIPCTAIFFHDIYVKYPKFEQVCVCEADYAGLGWVAWRGWRRPRACLRCWGCQLWGDFGLPLLMMALSSGEDKTLPMESMSGIPELAKCVCWMEHCFLASLMAAPPLFFLSSIAMISLVPLSEPLVRNSHRSSRYEKEARAMLAERYSDDVHMLWFCGHVPEPCMWMVHIPSNGHSLLGIISYVYMMLLCSEIYILRFIVLNT